MKDTFPKGTHHFRLTLVVCRAAGLAIATHILYIYESQTKCCKGFLVGMRRNAVELSIASRIWENSLTLCLHVNESKKLLCRIFFYVHLFRLYIRLLCVQSLKFVHIDLEWSNVACSFVADVENIRRRKRSVALWGHVAPLHIFLPFLTLTSWEIDDGH